MKGEGKELRKKYNVRGFPTVLFLKSNGDEIDRICGFDGNKEAYFKILNDYVAGKNTLAKMLSDIKRNPDDVDNNFDLGKKYRSRWETEKAAPYFYKVLKLDPKDKKGYKTESLCHTAVYESRVNKNIKPLLSFIASNKDKKFFMHSYYGLVSYYGKSKNKDKVIQTFEEGLKKMPENTEWMADYARYVVKEKIEKRYERAIELAKKAVELSTEKEKIQAYMQLGYFFQDLKRFKDAEKTFLKILKIWPEYTGAIYQLGRNTVFSGEGLKKGLSYFKEYLKHKPKPGDPDWSDALWRMGMIYEKMGNKKQAANQYKKALKLNPDHSASDHALKKLGTK